MTLLKTKRGILSLAILIFGSVIFLYFKGSLVLSPVLHRSVLTESDDAYVFLAKTIQMEECFLQDCRALDNLRKQSIGIEDPKIKGTITQRVFNIYHPAYSLALLTIKKIVGGPELAFNIFYLGIIALMAISIFYFLYTIWGAVVAGVSLALVGSFIFPGTGFNYLPSTLTTAIALGLYAVAIRRRVNARWFLFSGAILLPGFHTIGLIYSSILAGFYFLLNRKELTPIDFLLGTLIVASIATYLVLPTIIDRPLLFQGSLDSSISWSEFSGLIQANFSGAIHTIKVTAKFLGGDEFTWATSRAIWTIPLILLGIYGTPKEYRGPVTLLFVLFLLACTFSNLYVLPAHMRNFSGELFKRLWFIPTIFLVAFFSQGIVRAGTGLVAEVTKCIDGMMKSRSGIENPILFYCRSVPITSTILIGLLALFFVFEFSIQSQNLRRTEGRINWQTYKQDYRFDVAQPRYLSDLPSVVNIIYSSGNPEGSVRSSLLLMTYFLTHGNLKNGAFLKEEFNAAMESEMQGRQPTNDYLVTWNPIEQLPNIRSGGFDFSSTTNEYPIRIKAPRPQSKRLYFLFVNNSGKEAAFNVKLRKSIDYDAYVNSYPDLLKVYSEKRVSLQSKSDFGKWHWESHGRAKKRKLPERELIVTRKTIPALGQSWVRVDDIDLIADSGSLELHGQQEPGILLSGIRYQLEDPTYWPWDTGIIVKYKGPNHQRRYNKGTASGESYRERITFDTEGLCNCKQKVVRIISDSGSTVLAELEK
jgi:hypothetical protein